MLSNSTKPINPNLRANAREMSPALLRLPLAYALMTPIGRWRTEARAFCADRQLWEELTMIRLLALIAAFALAGSHGAAAQKLPEYGDDIYKPSMGQAGKDVIWIPTPDALITALLGAAKVTKDDVVYDLGAGDGRIPIAAARQFGARAIGIEYEAEMAELARRNAQRAGVEGRVRIITGDIFKENFTEATVVTMYLLPDLNLKLRPLILQMKPGTRVASHAFNMGDWEPDEYMSVEARDGYLWYVPASVEGTWAFREETFGTEGTVMLVQHYQRVGGTITIGGKTQPVLGAALRGDALTFAFNDSEGVLRAAHVVVNGPEFKGRLTGRAGNVPITGSRR
jgi:SAM-dependent methyltransferase